MTNQMSYSFGSNPDVKLGDPAEQIVCYCRLACSDAHAPVPEIHLLPGRRAARGAALSDLGINPQLRHLSSAICCGWTAELL